MNAQHSADVLTEMVRSIKEDQLPSMHREITNRLDVLNDTILDHATRIEALQQFQNQHQGELRAGKWFIGIILTVAGVALTAVKIVL